ncbi:MAG: T9SS type A sorting domain-containing protein [Bacteroidaceae bacterium]|nr:T9SS type A sorting domain-containing protein [Bacteroidaceae bacterium]
MNTIRFRNICFLLLLWTGSVSLSAQTVTYVVRYVSARNGEFLNGGTSWADAKNNLQNAIDELYGVIGGDMTKVGYIFVEGSETGEEYKPSRRSNEDADGSVFNTSFSIYEGIHIFGGFKGDEIPDAGKGPETLPGKRIMDNVAILGQSVDKTYAEVENDIDADRIGQTVRRWNFKYKTILSGNHSATSYSFRFDTNRGVYTTSFPMNSYHVVWFATNGKLTPDREDYPALNDEEYRKMSGHYKGLVRQATLDGVTIEGGYASSSNLVGHDHTGYGGGVYMVRNALLRNCIVHHCSAMQRGGGVYMDGGGEVERCYVHTCQATGYGMQQGYGGAVCIDYDGALKHSYVIQSAARIGAGLAICHVPNEYPEATAKKQDATFNAAYATEEDGVATPYDPFALSTVIANCTSNAEGAGVYLDEGGTLNHCSVVNNKCIGPDVIYYGRRHGRTGGIYIRNGGTIYNSVAWGNECAVNNDVQFAAFKDGSKSIHVYHSAFSKGDITDWAAATKESIISLENANYPSPEHKEGYFPMFKQPTVDAGVQYESSGAVDPTKTGDGESYQRVYNWHPLAMSDLRAKAVQVTDAVQGLSSEIIHAHTDVDVVGRSFEAVSSCGALAHSYRNIQYALLPSQEKVEGRLSSETELMPTLFVDPNLLVAGGENDDENTGFLDDQPMGTSWTHPMVNLADAIYFFKAKLKDTNFVQADYTDHPEKTYYCLCEGDTHDPSKHYNHVQILVKEGKMNVAGQGSYISGHARTASIRPGSNMRLYGGFPSTNTGVEADGRSPFDYNSDISADVLGGDFDNNTVHVVAIANQHDVIIDGFRLQFGNANVTPPPGENATEAEIEESNMYHSLADGAGVVVNNAMTANPAKRRDMTGNILRNVVIANCAAPEGAAIYVSGGFQRGNADGSAVSDELCRAELTVVNSIIRNCTAGNLYDENGVYHSDMFIAKPEDTPATMKITLQGVVTANGNGKIWVRNSDVVNNCGFPFKCDQIESIPNTPGDPTYGGLTHDYPDAGHIEVYNSVIFSNGLRVHADRSNITNTVFCPKESWYNVTGQYLFMGYDVLFPDDLAANFEANHIYRTLTHNKSEDNSIKYHRKNDGSQQGTTDLSDEATKVTVRYPVFVNPSRNVGHTEGEDQSYYGGRVNYEPLPTNPIVNAGNTDMITNTGILSEADKAKSIGYDFSLDSRNYGGDPDVGAIETHRLPPAGSVLYVTPDGAGRRDGSSWANAIAGNTVYVLDNVAGPALATGDQVDSEPTCDRILDSSGNPVLTTDNKYCGGFGRVWLTDKKTGETTSTVVTQTWITEKNVYDDGIRAGEEEILQDGSTPTETSNTTVTAGTTPVGFTAGYDYDSRYPYGEISGASRSFWRANPYHNGAGWNNAADYADVATFIDACNTNGWICNDRSERYVGGLQYAVEKAAAYNALAEGASGRIEGVDSVQVWVSNGEFTDYKGFVMRDNTTVIGSFPAKDGGTPSLTERQALMSAVINIPKSLTAQDLEAEDYETILQISDVDPKADNETLNTDAVKYWDDDYAMVSSTNTTSHEYKDRAITHHYTLETDAEFDHTSDYILNSVFDVLVNDNFVPTSTTTVGGIKYYDFGTAVTGYDQWHLKHPVKTNYVANIENSDNNKNKKRNIYDPDTNQQLTGTDATFTGNWIFISNGSLTGAEFWQTIPTVPAGEYKLCVDMAGGYRNKFTSTDPTNIFFHIIGADGSTELVAPVMLKTIGSYNNNTDVGVNRSMAYRYALTFTQPAAGSVTIKIVVEDGVRNTKSANATYGTDTGGDPDPIPSSYATSYGSNNPNRREFWMSNLKLYEIIRGTTYVETSTDDVTTDRVVDNPEPSEVTSGDVYTMQTHRTTLRKRVLTMPDICVPTYGGGSVGDPVSTNRGKLGDNLSHTHRVFGPTKAKRTSWENSNSVKEDPNYVEYTDVFWDGFTIRHGFIADESMAHGGGSGVNMYEGAHLQNSIVINNMSYSPRVKGGGIFCDGATSTIEGCFVLNNTSTHGTNTVQDQIFAGGMFLYEGTCFNSLFAKNYSYGSAGGLGFCVGRFYNNTIAYNICNLIENGNYSGGAISLATASSPNLFVANTIIYGNNGIAIRDRNTAVGNVNPFLHCYVQSEVAQPYNATLKNVTDWTESNKNNYGVGNVFLNGVAPSAENTPFDADLEDGVYTGGASIHNDFRLLSSNYDCINKGTEEFAATLYTALSYKGKTDSQITGSFIYQSVENSELPNNDVAFADRIQDCQVDIGAYEFDGTRAIEPSLFPDEKKAIFFVTQTGYGMATAENPVNAACYLKFQKVLDAAGRWRYASYFYANADSLDAGAQKENNFDEAMLREELRDAGVAATVDDAAITAELPNLKDYEVIVRLEGENGSGFSYIPTRSTNLNTESVNELEKSLIVPHGITIEGGYEYNFTEDRDVLGRPTRFSGEIVNEVLGTRGNVYHVVTFTNDLFDIHEKRIGNGGQLQFLGKTEANPDNVTNYGGTFTQAEAESHRAVLDGLFIQGGDANGTSAEHRQGAGAVVTKYAHIRNCVIQNNSAAKYGGGLYLEPQALVSGCIVKNNSAMQGGGLYVVEPGDDQNPLATSSETYVHIISTTVVDNTATQNAGGLWFQTNLRANSSAFWRNTASDYGNVAGVFATGLTQVVENYPLNYCGVGSRRVAGVNNIELPSVASEGVRWDGTMPYENGLGQESVYFPILVSSVLGRSGMTYAAYRDFQEIYPTLESQDIFGLNRMEQTTEENMTLADGSTYTKVVKNNSFIEMGARVMNGNFEVKLEYTHVMTRLFVSTTERFPTSEALDLQKNTVENEIQLLGDAWTSLTTEQQTEKYKELEDKVEMYKQMGSSFLNPFHRFGDALEYIVKVRKETSPYVDANGGFILDSNGNNMSVAEFYKNQRFEVFLCGGSFYPFRDAHGNQGEARANTFLLPEMVTVVGGVNHQEADHAYCQETTGELTVAGHALNPATTYEIRSAREHMDRNGNHVKEPWEMKEQTIFDGNAVMGDARTNVYHVITCVPDVNQVGKLPTRYTDDELDNRITTTSEGLIVDEDIPSGIGLSQEELLDNIRKESRKSRDTRTIIIDGVTITGGHANAIETQDESDDFKKLTYFRGGGVLVEGNWNQTDARDIQLAEVLGVAKRNIPLIMTSCLVKDNEAGNGGGVYTNGTYYAFSCHFTKNESAGPEKEADQKYIPWSAGGAIANNYECHLWNSLFANNEAVAGNYPILQRMRKIDEAGDDSDGNWIINPIHNANARRGYGGAVSCSETGLARICNCDFVRNQAVAFPALYNFLDNNLRAQASIGATITGTPEPGTLEALQKEMYQKYGPGWHFAVNSIFWGNRATATELAEATNIAKEYYDKIYSGGWTDLRRPYHIANFAPKLDVATLTFCSYEQGTGREGTVWYSNHDNAKAAPILEKDGMAGLDRLYAGLFTDVLDEYFGYYKDGASTLPYYQESGDSKIPSALDYVDLKRDNRNVYGSGDGQIDHASMMSAHPDATERYSYLMSALDAVAYNYNLVLETENNVPGGPYFVQPSLSAGIDGYMENSDWLVARLNNSIDTGWGFLKQDVTQESESSGLFNTTLLDKNEVKVTESTNQYEELYGEGFYNLHSSNVYNRFKDLGFPNLLPIGDETYMEYSREGEGEETNMRRISTHPKMGVQDVFIDMGIYEYQYVQLVTAGDEIDVIWVSPTQNTDVTCDGSTSYRATSDLQGAIETLLLSRNDHDKMIKLKEGVYSPTMITQNNRKAFFVNVPSKQDGVLLPKTLNGDETHVAKSLTFRGGYPEDILDFPMKDYEDERDIEDHKVTFSMTYDLGNEDSQLEHLFIIEDAEQKGSYVNYLSNKNPDFTDKVMPIIFDGVTFMNPYGHNHEKGGAALYYNEQYQTVDDNEKTYPKDPDRLLKAAADTEGGITYPMPKLLIKDCTFMACGQCENVSAVTIEKGGGESLIVNSVFHSNGGAPVKGVNTQLVNCTSALNGGHLTLTTETETYYDGTSVSTYHSGVYNSIIWKDDEAQTDASEKKMWEGDINVGTAGGGADDTNMKYNAFTQWTGSDFYVPTGVNWVFGTGNIRLSPENGDVMFGPNFIDPEGVIPETGTAEEKALEQKSSRDFRLNPSARILNQADKPTYTTLVPYYAETRTQRQTTKTGENASTYYFHSVQRAVPATLTDKQLTGTDDTASSSTETTTTSAGETITTVVSNDKPYTERERAYKARQHGAGIELGAYECTAMLQRVLYVMDGAIGKQDGTSWEDAYEIDRLQQAVDVASIYSLTSAMSPEDRERAYVFVIASNYPNNPLNLRDGVSVYGGITNYMYEVEKDNDGKFSDANIAAYVTMMKAERNGLVTKNVAHNVVKGLVADNVAPQTSGFLLDGFWIQGGTATVDMTKAKTVLTNDVITGNTVATAGQPVVDVGDGLTEDGDEVLLYNTLIYGNTPGSGAPVVSVGGKGYLLNNTIVAANTGEVPLASGITGTAGEKAAHLAANALNNIAVNEADGQGKMFAPYLRINANAYTPPVYLTEWAPYGYQLHEQSAQINAGVDDNGVGTGNTVKDGGNSIAKLFPDYVDFSSDRDLLGNPRRLRGRVDNGAFETWCIEANAAVKATNLTNYVERPTPTGEQTQHEANVAAGYYNNCTINYGGHLYPHSGSVVYVMDNASLVFDVDDDGAGNKTPRFTSIVNPGYVLLKPGASIYGQGNPLGFSYVAVDKPYSADAQYGLQALPYPHNEKNAVVTSYNSGTDQLTQTAYTNIDATYSYDGARRAAWNSVYYGANSDYWEEWDDETDHSANDGYLIAFKTPLDAARTVRFTGWGATESDYAYDEDGSNKTVTLTQYDYHDNSSGKAHFTHLEDMGWNLKGAPYLISNFATDTKVGTKYRMNVPHLFYDMNPDGTYNYHDKPLGQFYTKRSWDSGTTLTIGEGFFTQTAIIEGTEALAFYWPYYSDSPAAVTPAKPRVAMTFVSDEGEMGSRSQSLTLSDVVDVYPVPDADPSLPYVQGRDGVKWSPVDRRAPELYAVGGEGVRMSLLASAPTETDIPLGISTPVEGTLTFSLPTPDAYADYQHVWLTDHVAGTVTDLMEHAYTLQTETAGHDTERLTLRIGGMRPDVESHSDHSYLIYTRGHRLFVKNLLMGDLVSVYSVDGILLDRTTANNSEYEHTLNDGIYVVQVNNTVKKVIVK